MLSAAPEWNLKICCCTPAALRGLKKTTKVACYWRTEEIEMWWISKQWKKTFSPTYSPDCQNSRGRGYVSSKELVTSNYFISGRTSLWLWVQKMFVRNLSHTHKTKEYNWLIISVFSQFLKHLKTDLTADKLTLWRIKQMNDKITDFECFHHKWTLWQRVDAWNMTVGKLLYDLLRAYSS